MPVASQACPKCDPHLASSAGMSSVQQGIQLEPAFTRKKKAPENSKRVTFLSTYPSSESTSSVKGSDKAECFKAGYRRPNTSHPTSYQTHFCRPWPGKLGSRTSEGRRDVAPLIEAAKHLDQGERSKPRQPQDSGAHSLECPHSKSHKTKVTIARQDDRKGLPAPQGDDDLPEGVVVKRTQAPKSRRPLFVDPLPIPLADEGSRKNIGGNERRTKAHPSEPKRLDDRPKKGLNLAKTKEKLPEKSSKTLPAHQVKKMELSKKVFGGEERRKRRNYVSPLKKLYEKDQAMHARAVGTFETEYQKHYRDWVGEAWQGKKGRQQQRSETPPPHINAHGGPPVLTDPSDPRLLKHSPPPHAGDVVPQDRWVTQYNLHYGRGPSEYSYQRGAFKLKEHRDIENFAPTDGEVNPSLGGVEDKESSDYGGHDPNSLSWFDQLVELRHKADQYKWQSERTNFQPHYMLQVRDSMSSQDARNLDRDASSAGSSTSSDPQAGPARRRGHSLKAEVRPEATKSRKVDSRLGERWEGRKRLVDGKDRLVVEDIESDEDPVPRPKSMDQSKPVGISQGHSHVHSVGGGRAGKEVEEARCTCNIQKSPAPPLPVQEELDEFDGRIPTSELRRKAPHNIRHHFDPTTPFLVSSPKESQNFSSSSPSYVQRDGFTRNRSEEEPKMLRKSSAGCLGAGGRDFPRHSPICQSPLRARKGSEKDRHVLPGARSRSRTPPISRKNERGAATSKSGDRSWAIKPGTSSCDVCGSSLKPAAIPSSSIEKPLGKFPVSRPLKGNDYVVPATVAAQPSGVYGRVCDKTEDHYGIRHKLHSSQRESQRQLQNIRNKMSQHHSGNLVGGHSHKRKYEPSSYRYTPEENVNEVENLSLSPLSMSSCSVASDILEKARKRRDRLWVGCQQPTE